MLEHPFTGRNVPDDPSKGWFPHRTGEIALPLARRSADLAVVLAH
jgi:hypothetical protein